MADQEQPRPRGSFFSPSRFWKRELWIFLCGTVFGAGCLVLIAGLILRNGLAAEYASELSFDEVAQALPELVGKHMPGWTVNTEGCMLSHLPDGRRMIVFKFCNRKYASMLLERDARTASVLPCSMAVQERPDGTAALVRLNTSWLGFIFKGEAVNVFRQMIAPEQERLLDALKFRKIR